jgi:hypothetical protein
MKWLGYVVAFVIGILAIALPLAMSWNPESTKTSIGFGIGVIIATIYAVIRGIPTSARAGAPAGGPGVTVSFGGMEWYDWVVLIVCVVGGFVIGMIV